MMYLPEIKYPLRLCVEMMHYCTWSNEKTAEIRPSELLVNLEVFFSKELIEESRKILCGEITPVGVK